MCPIAKGAFSTVYRCADLTTGKMYAVKVVSRTVIEANNMHNAVVREINAMEVAPSSKYLVNLVDKLVSSRNYYLVMDLVEGGTLFDLLQEWRLTPSSQWARRLFRQLLNGLETLHRSNVVHRDIKPENLLLNEDHTQLMISDFGFASYAPPGRMLHRACGTLKYCAPELLLQSPEYDGRKVDVWAAGVTLYVMLFGRHPFEGDDDNMDSLVQAILAGGYSFPQRISPHLEHLFSVMLQPVPAKRWPVKQLLRHVWVLGVDGVKASLLPRSPDSIGVTANNCGSCRALPVEYIVRSSFARALKDDCMDLFIHRCRSCPDLSREMRRADNPDEWSNGSAARNEDSDDIALDVDGSIDAVHFDCNGEGGGPLMSPESTPSDNDNVSISESALPFSLHRNSTSSVSSSSFSKGSSDESPPSHKRDLMLTIRVIVNFLLFCTSLVLVGGLRLLFDVDFSELPIPSFIHRTVENLLVPPHEWPAQRFEVHRMRHSLPGATLRRLFAWAEGVIDTSDWRRRMVPTREVSNGVHPCQKQEVRGSAIAPQDSSSCSSTLRRRYLR
ncbi:Small Surface Antigen [Trypanosoma grayi]|uniref:Small Surface Antigen n=1 Tax=Trypanosoma grayi TaxID=71804 RepID=UPI0004F473F6|nr:Small Surface Antigen [Trypanosoma grayi]KEG10504.1 Small Surface Antigen [Trypanosoma grayi]